MKLIEFDFVTKDDIALMLKCHPNTVLLYKKNQGWIEGIHYVNFDKRKLYNRQLILNLVQCGGVVESEEHQRAIAVYLANRLDNQSIGRKK